MAFVQKPLIARLH